MDKVWVTKIILLTVITKCEVQLKKAEKTTIEIKFLSLAIPSLVGPRFNFFGFVEKVRKDVFKIIGSLKVSHESQT